RAEKGNYSAGLALHERTSVNSVAAIPEINRRRDMTDSFSQLMTAITANIRQRIMSRHRTILATAGDFLELPQSLARKNLYATSLQRWSLGRTYSAIGAVGMPVTAGALIMKSVYLCGAENRAK